jgi:hypothetical protein
MRALTDGESLRRVPATVLPANPPMPMLKHKLTHASNCGGEGAGVQEMPDAERGVVRRVVVRVGPQSFFAGEELAALAARALGEDHR